MVAVPMGLTGIVQTLQKSVGMVLPISKLYLFLAIGYTGAMMNNKYGKSTPF